MANVLPGPVPRAAAAAVALVTLPTAGCGAAGVAAVRLGRAATTAPAGPDHVMALGATVALTVALAWLAVAVGTGCVDAVGRLTRREPAAPPRRRGGVPALACALVLAVASPATAAAGEPTPPTAPATGPAASPATTVPATQAAASPAPLPGTSATPVPGWVPQVSRVPPAVTALVTSAAPAGSPEPGPAPHVVVAGDTLWGIAAAHLGADATAAEIASRWPRWWRANHAVVGDDPDLLRPGQVLHPPPPGD